MNSPTPTTQTMNTLNATTSAGRLPRNGTPTENRRGGQQQRVEHPAGHRRQPLGSRISPERKGATSN